MRPLLSMIAAFLKPKRRWFQFSLRTLLLLITAFAVLLGLKADRVNKQRRAISAVEELGGHVRYDYRKPYPPDAAPPGPAWLRRLVGDEYFVTLVGVGLEGTEVKDADLEELMQHLTVLPRLRMLDLRDTQIGDTGVKHIKRLASLESPWLYRTSVTDAGLKHIKELTSLRELGLNETSITDAGLPHLKGLTELESLGIAGTGITDAGLRHLRTFRKLRDLNIQYLRVTDDGLV